ENLKKGELSIFPKTFTVSTPCLRTPQKAKSAAAADNAWTPGRGRNPDACILKDPVFHLSSSFVFSFCHPQPLLVRFQLVWVEFCWDLNT
ncbi:hypothetical protein Tco_0498447, partial [Tanacetum coccineum]